MEPGNMAEAIAELRQQVRQLEAAEIEQWKALDSLRDRLPNWAVLAGSTGGGIIGFLMHWLGSCLR